MEYNGIRIDIANWRAVADEIELDALRLEQQLDDLLVAQYQSAKTEYEESKEKTPELEKRIKKLGKFVHDSYQYDLFNDLPPKVRINWASPAQRLELLQQLGFKLDSTDRRQLTKIKDANPLIPVLIEYGEKEKLVTSFGNNFIKEHINKITGLVHPNYFQIVSTGRISCKEPNLLNIPGHGPLAKRIRASFIPKPGYKIVGGDFSNFELRIIAEFSQDPLWLKVFNEGGDLHKELCIRTFKIDYNQVNDPYPLKPTQTYRETQKTIDFGLAYGMSEYKLADMLSTIPRIARGIIDDFFSIIPKVRDLLEMFALGAQTHGYIRTATPFRRIRWFPKLAEAKLKDNFKVIAEVGREAKNSPIQGTNGDAIKLALCNLQDEIEANNYPMQILLSVYDEIQTECPADFAEQAKVILERVMIDSAKEILKTVPIKVDVSINDYWKKG